MEMEFKELFSPVSLAMYQPPPSRLARCGECGLFKTCQSPRMPISGKGKRNILVVAEAPGKEEDRQGKALVGETGQKIANTLAVNQINMREDCTLTNALICRPPGNVIKDPKAIEYCRPNLLNTLKEVKPEIILLLGGVAVESLIGHLWKDEVGGISRWAGYQIPCQKLNAWICPTFHPAYLIRTKNPVLEKMFAEHIAAMAELECRPWQHTDKVPDYREQVERIYKPDQAAKRLRDIKDGTIAFDYETNMLKPDSSAAEIVSCSVCYNGKWTIAFPWFGGAIKDAMRKLLANPNVVKIASNAKFEHRWSKAVLGVTVRGWTMDTMLAAHALENASKKRKIASIKFQAFVHLGQEDYSSHIDPYLKSKGGNTPNRIKEVDLPTLLLYNGLDSLLEYKVGKRQGPRLRGEE